MLMALELAVKVQSPKSPGKRMGLSVMITEFISIRSLLRINHR